ncbi:transposase [Streptomyces sp. NPDC093982]|uniref:transposase n=1 Tax=Streptomyces sp. NPDC093982 TaxID=3155077 RepID=UPI00341DA3B0
MCGGCCWTGGASGGSRWRPALVGTATGRRWRTSSSPWDATHVRARLAWKMHEAIGPEALVIDDTGFLKDGDWLDPL